MFMHCIAFVWFQTNLIFHCSVNSKSLVKSINQIHSKMSVENSPSKASRSQSVIDSVDDFESQVSCCYAYFYKFNCVFIFIWFLSGYFVETRRYYYRGVWEAGQWHAACARSLHCLSNWSKVSCSIILFY